MIDELQQKKDQELLEVDSKFGSYFTHLECAAGAAPALRSARASFSLSVLQPPAAGPLRSGGGARVEDGIARRPRAEHVALSRADAAAAGRRAGHARRRLHAADSCAGASARRSASIACSSRTNRSIRPTRSRRAAQSAAITRAKALGATDDCLPTAGNAGNAAAAYAAAAGLACEVFIPKDAKQPFIDECRLYGANVTLVDGLITDAGRMAAETGKPLGWYDVSTFRESRTASKARRRWATSWPSSSTGRCPTGSSIPPAAAPAWSACGRRSTSSRRSAGSTPGRRPKMVSVQAEGCAPIVRAFERGAEKAGAWENAHTVADGLRVPRAIGDFLILRAIRDSGGTALAVCDADMVGDMMADRPRRGRLRRARRRRGARAPCGSSSPTDDQEARDRRALQHRRRAEVSRS